MSVGIEEMLGKMQETVDEAKHKDVQIEQLQSTMAAMREELEEQKAKTIAFEPYEDIILDPDATKEWKQINIRSPHTYKELLIRCRQVYGNTRPISVAAVVENALGYALSRAGWARVVKTRYPDNLREEANVEDV